MTKAISEMIDIVFDLDSGILPASYPFMLWTALIQRVPQLEQEKFVGVLPLRATESKDEVLLSRRTKLVLRLPKLLADHAATHLSGSTLELGDISLTLGKCKPRPIQPSPTIHAQMVAGALDEIQFMGEVNAQLSSMGIAANLICGKRRTISSDRQSLHGFSLVLHDLKQESSMQLQYAGLGESRQFGCGIFIPYKVISGLSDD